MERSKSPNLACRGLALVFWLGTALPLWANSPADALYAVAAAHYGQGEWELAEKAFDRFVRAHPEDARAAGAEYYRGECLVQAERYRPALELFERFLTRYPEHAQSPRAQFRAGELALRLGERAKAERYLTEFRGAHQGHELEAFALPHLASLSLEEGNAERAAELYALALSSFPRGPLAAECRLGVAAAQEQLGNWEEAERFYRVAALSRDTAVNTQARLRLAILSCKRDQFSTALELLESLADEIDQPAWASQVNQWRGRALSGLGRRRDAADIWWSGVEQWPDSELAESLAYQAAQTYRQLGDRALAHRAYRWLSEREPASRWGEESLATRVTLLLEDAHDLLVKSASASPPSSRVEEAGEPVGSEEQRAMLPHGRLPGDDPPGDPQGAADLPEELEREVRQVWRQMVRRYPSGRFQEPTLQRIGHHLLRQGKYQQMLDVLADLGESDPDRESFRHAQADGSRAKDETWPSPVRSATRPSPIVSYLYALTYWGLERPEAAWQRLVELQDEDLPSSLRPGAVRLRAACLMALRRYDEAIPELERDIRQQPATQSARSLQLQLALALTEIGRWDEAESVLDSLDGVPSPRAGSQHLAAADNSPQGPATSNDSRPTEPVRRRVTGDLPAAEAEPASVGATSELSPPLATWSETASGPEVSQVAYLLAEQAYAARQYSLATRQFQRVAEQSPDHPLSLPARLGWSWSLFQSGQLAAAGKVLDPLLRRELGAAAENRPAAVEGAASATEAAGARSVASLQAEAAYLRGRMEERLNRPGDAARYYDQSASADPTSRFAADSLFAAARLRDKRGESRAAAERLETLLAQFPAYPRADSARYLLAWARVDLGEDDSADQVFQQLMDEHPESEYWPDAVYRLAERSASRDDISAAERLVAKLLERAPGARVAPQAVYLHGQLAAAGQRWADLERAMQRLLCDYPESSLQLQAEYWRAEAGYQQGRYDAAARQFERLAASTEPRREAWVAMISLRWAQCLAHRGEWEAARRVAAGISGRFPDFAQQYEADYVVGRALVHEAKLGQARDAFHRVTRSPTGRGTETAAMAQWMIGETYFHQRKFGEAAEAYLVAETLYAYPRWRAAARLQLAKCYEAQQKWEAAIRYYKLVIDNQEVPQLVSEAEQHLSRLELREAQLGSSRRSTTPH
jgi:TolA-binding protein